MQKVYHCRITPINHFYTDTMKEPQALNSVARFHRLFGHPIEKKPLIPAAGRCQLRIDLLQEELDELRQVIADGNLTEVADALCDLQYVLAGAVLEFGMGEVFAELFDEVQRSNMSKACRSRQEAEATVDHYGQQGVAAYYEEKDGLFLVYRQGDRKTLKSVNYSPADLTGILANHK